MTLVAICLVISQHMHPSGTVVEIWWMKDNVVLDIWGSCDVIGHVTIRFSMVDFLWVVHCDHTSIWHRYWDIAIWSSSRKAFPVREVDHRSSKLHWFHIVLFATLGTSHTRSINWHKRTPKHIKLFYNITLQHAAATTGWSKKTAQS